MIETGIQISVIYTDEHLIELRVTASNGVFAGQADVYANIDAPAEFAGVLRGFPVSQSDAREFEIGDLGTANAGGGAGFRFHCVDSVCHAVAEVRLQSDSLRGGGVSDYAVLHVPVEAASVDAFVEQLEGMAAVVGHAAVLEAAT